MFFIKNMLHLFNQHHHRPYLLYLSMTAFDFESQEIASTIEQLNLGTRKKMETKRFKLKYK